VLPSGLRVQGLSPSESPLEGRMGFASPSRHLLNPSFQLPPLGPACRPETMTTNTSPPHTVATDPRASILNCLSSPLAFSLLSVPVSFPLLIFPPNVLFSPSRFITFGCRFRLRRRFSSPAGAASPSLTSAVFRGSSPWKQPTPCAFFPSRAEKGDFPLLNEDESLCDVRAMGSPVPVSYIRCFFFLRLVFPLTSLSPLCGPGEDPVFDFMN